MLNLSTGSDSDISLQYIGKGDSSSEEIESLKQQNRKLKDEYNSLKTQFEEAVSVSDQIDSLCQENQSLAKKNRDLQSQLNELQRRLEISLHLNDELRDKMAQESEATQACISSETEQMHKQMHEKEKALLEQVKAAKKETTDVQLKLSQLEKKQSENDKIAGNLLRVSTKRFGIKFSGLASLCDYIQELPRTDQPVEKEVQVLPDTNKLTAKLAKRKKQTRDLRQEKTQVENEVKMLKEQMQKAKKEFDCELAKAGEEIANLKSEQKLTAVKHQEQISELQKEKQDVEEKLNKEKAKNVTLSQKPVVVERHIEAEKSEVPQLKATIAELTEDVKRAVKCNGKLKKKTATLTDALQMSENDQKDLKRQLGVLMGHNEEITARMENLCRENDALIGENNAIKEKLATSQNECSMLSQKHVNAKAAYAALHAELGKAKESITVLENQVNQQQIQINEEVFARQKQCGLVARQESSIAEQKSEIESLTKENRDLKDALASAQIKKSPPIATEVIPQSSWFCVDFPKELGTAVADIGKKENIQVAARLRQAFSTIAHFYSRAAAAKDEKIEQAEAMSTKVVETLAAMVQVINSHIGDPVFQPESFINDVFAVKDLESRFEEVRDIHEAIVQEKQRLEDLLREAAKRLSVDSLNAVDNAIARKIAAIEAQEAQIKQLHSQNKQLKQEHNRFVDEMQQKEDLHERNIEDKEKEIGQIMSEKKEQITEGELYKLKIASLEKEIKRLHKQFNEKYELLKDELESSNSQTLEELKSEHQHKITLLEQSHNESMQKANAKIQESQAKADKLKKRVETTAQKVTALERQIIEMENESADCIRATKARCAEEIEQIKAHHQSIVAKLQESIDAKSEDLRKTAVSLSEAQAECKRVIVAKNQAESERRQLAMKITAHQEELSREKRLAETKIKAFAMTSDMKRRSAIEEITSRCEEEKRSIYHFGAELFKQFFDPRRQLGDESFRQLLLTAKDELVRTQKQEANIRKLLGASHSETAEEAVARITARRMRI